jgi:hypothetical protein
MTNLETIKEKLQELETKRKETLKEIQKDFPGLFTELFAKSERINSFSWNQYTPYFNDGDECIFSVNTDYPDVNGENIDYLKWTNPGTYGTITEENLQLHNEFNASPNGHSWYIGRKVGENGYFPNPDFDEKEFKIVEEFSEILDMIPEEFLRELFGDHVEVTLHRNGTIETTRYDHE